MQFSGHVIKKAYAPSTKSAHDALFLATDEGTYLLRRIDGNSFRDPELDRLVGKAIECEGDLHGNLLLITDWRETPSGSR